MDSKKLFTLLISTYLVICGILIFDSGLFGKQENASNQIITLAAQTKSPAKSEPEIAPLPEKDISQSKITAVSAEEKTFTLGSILPAKENPYTLEIILTTKGAAITSARLRDYDNRDPKNPQPLELLSTIETTNTMSSERLELLGIGKYFPLDKINWQSSGVAQNSDGAQTISFYAEIFKDGDKFAKLTNTYTLKPEDYLLN